MPMIIFSTFNTAFLTFRDYAFAKLSPCPFLTRCIYKIVCHTKLQSR